MIFIDASKICIEGTERVSVGLAIVDRDRIGDNADPQRHFTHVFCVVHLRQSPSA